MPGNAEKSVDELVQEVRSRLHNDIKRLHGQIPLYGVDGLVPLGELNVNILEQRSSSRRSELDDLWEDFISEGQDTYGYRSFDRMGIGRNLKCVAGDKVLEKDNNLMVVGKPGSGKTTYLQHIVIKCNDGLLQPHRIPVLIKLRDFVKDGRRVEYCLKHYLCWQWGLSEDNTERVLKDGKALILLDGLDEVTGTDGQAIAEQIEYFARTYPQNQLVVTSRTQCQTVGFGQFEYVEVDNFNKAQVQNFADRWFEAITSNIQEGQEKAKQFLDQLYLPEHHQIRELAITPILLSLTCSVFYYRGKFYSQRSKLYQEAIELLLERWDKERRIERDEIYRELSSERKQQLLCYLAVTNFTKTKYYILFEQDEIEDYIAEAEVLEDLRISRQNSKVVLRAMEAQHGLLIERAHGFWSFSHLTFQEYFAAKWFCDRPDPDLDGLAEHVEKKQWREVFLLAIAMLPMPSADRLLRLMKQQVDALVATDKDLQEFLKRVSQRVRSLKTSCKPAYVRAFCLNFDREDVIIPTGGRNLNLSLTFDFNRILDIDSLLRLDYSFDCIYYLAYGFTSILSFDNISFSTYRTMQSCFVIRNLVSEYKRGLNRNFGYSRISSDSNIRSQFGYNRTSTTSELAQAVRKLTNKLTQKLNSALASGLQCTKDPKLKLKLQNLKDCLPDLQLDTYQWWQANGKSWTEKLQLAMFEHYHIGRDWQLSQEQKKLLQQYYDSNKLLVDCLNSNCEVSEELRKEIEETLLLPLDEITEYKQQIQVAYE